MNMTEKALSLLMPLLLLLPFSSLVSSQTPPTPQQLQCHDDDRSALLELKGSLGSDHSCFESWKIGEESRNCCSWRGVTCGGPFSQVIGLDLRGCKLHGSIPPQSHIPKHVRTLGLAQCDLKEFPAFLEKLNTLEGLDLSHNNLSGEIPEWFLNVRLQTLSYLNLSGNSLRGFPQDLSSYNSTRLDTLDLRFNKLQGSLPLPSKTPSFYLVSNNMLSGQIPQQICDWGVSGLTFLDLSKNNFVGELPQCMSRFIGRLFTLALHSNSFRGRIPPFGDGYCTLQTIDLSDNQFEGPLPRSLANCMPLNFLNLGNNRINDTFPSWLGSAYALSVLILRFNYFHGEIEEPRINPAFPSVRIIDLSHNDFQGSLPSAYFQYWKDMAESGHESNSYSGTNIVFPQGSSSNNVELYNSMTIINKGVETEYEKILGYFNVVDLSSNNFTGVIPDSISSLQGLHLLNLSDNMLKGPLHPSLGALTQLQALDLSRNELSGEIPQQLVELKFLAMFNVSYNNLSGPIPRGRQFDTFLDNSYWGNPGLCGDLLSRKCGSFGWLSPPSPMSKDEGSDVPFEVEWKAIAAGYAVTFVIGAVVGHKVIVKHRTWFARTFGMRQLGRQR